MNPQNLTFGKPPKEAYPTIGSLLATGQPLPERRVMRVFGSLVLRIEISEEVEVWNDASDDDIIYMAFEQAQIDGEYDDYERDLHINDVTERLAGFEPNRRQIRMRLEAPSDT